MMFVIVLLFIIALFIFYIRDECIEHMDNFVHASTTHSRKIDPVVYDMAFSDVKSYENDDNDDYYAQVTGMQKCLNDTTCQICVEQGVSGNANCYPYKIKK